MRKGIVFLVLLAFLVVPAAVSAVPYVSTASLNGGLYYKDFIETPTFADSMEAVGEDEAIIAGYAHYTHYVNLPDPSETYEWCLDIDIQHLALSVNGAQVGDFSGSRSFDLGTFALEDSILPDVHNFFADLVLDFPILLGDLGIDYYGLLPGSDTEEGLFYFLGLLDGDSEIVKYFRSYQPPIEELIACFAGSVTLTAKAVPEPGTIVLMGLGLVGIAGLGRKKYFKK